VPAEIVAAAPPGARVRDTASMHLHEIIAEMVEADARGDDVARVHSGDPSIYGAIAEQMRRLDELGIAWEIVPGVPAFAAAAARLGTELTLPERAQTIILTRTAGKASPMPDSERLEVLGASRATLAIHLSIRNLGYVEAALTPHYGPDCPVAIVFRATWPDEQIILTTLAGMRARVREAKITRTALVFVGAVFGPARAAQSRLYAAGFAHVLRNAGKKKDRVSG
jgi:precorrin-4/cobalt-precorrin-4 C11-methyltransferase